MKVLYEIYPSPAGDILVAAAGGGGLITVQFLNGRAPASILAAYGLPAMQDNGGSHTAAAVRQLDEYFAGSRRRFELELALAGTDFRRRIWAQVARIPYGETRSYGQIAAAAGAPGAARAVGQAVGANPFHVVIPCHRVLGARGAITGFAGGLGAKRFLLGLEGARYIGQSGCGGDHRTGTKGQGPAP